MLKGIAIWNYPGNRLENAKEFARRGFTAVSYLGQEFAKMTQEDDEMLAAFLREKGICFTVHSRLPDPESTEAVEQFKAEMRRAAAWQKKYGLLRGYTFDSWFDIDLNMPNLVFALEALREMGVFVCCEDTPLNSRSYQKYKKILRPEYDFGILIDLGHMNIRQRSMELHEPENFAIAIREIPLPIKEVHLHDNRSRKDDHMYIGYGNLPLKACVEAFSNRHFDGIVTVEIVQRDWPAEQGFVYAEQAFAAFSSYLR